MTGRIVAAAVLASLACGATSGALILLGIDRVEGSTELPLYFFFLPGMSYGALFVIFVLLPLLLVLRNRHMATRTAVTCWGLVLWVLLVALLTATAWNLPLRAWLGLIIPLLIPGIVLVLVFSLAACRST
jgi:hypothetical protein